MWFPIGFAAWRLVVEEVSVVRFRDGARCSAKPRTSIPKKPPKGAENRLKRGVIFFVKYLAFI